MKSNRGSDPAGNKMWVAYHGYFPNSSVIIHREDGPAIERVDGTKEWWLYDKQLPCSSQEEFERFLRFKAFW